jgi:peroxin-5
MWVPTHPIPEDTLHAMVTNLSWDVHECLTNAFLSLAREQHVQEYIDADVQIGLGILYYSHGKFGRAKDYEEVLCTYREALQLRPTYTRAFSCVL